MSIVRRVSNILRYGVGRKAKIRKDAAKQKIREKKFASQNWKHGQELASRKYDSYEEYLSHQASKLDRVEHRLREMEGDDYSEFLRRFEKCSQLSKAHSVLCLGARLGTEVRALNKLGHFSGIPSLYKHVNDKS